MKCVVAVLLLGLCSTGLASARSGHVLRNEDEPELPYYTNMRQCSDQLQACQMTAVQQFHGETLENALEKLRNAGARQFCRVSAEVHLCSAEVLEEPHCEELKPYILDFHTELLKAAEKVCVTKRDELEKHWSCLLSDTVHRNLYQCLDQRNCKTIGPVVDCVAEYLAKSSNCESGADEFVRDGLPRSIINMYLCYYFPDGPRALMKFLKI